MNAEVRNAAGSMIRALGIRKSFGSNMVLKDVSLEVAQGEVVALIGPSGSGKSTLLRCLNLLEIPDMGTLAVSDEHRFTFSGPGTKISMGKAANLRRDMGMVFQHFNLFPHMTVLANIMEGPIQVKKMSRKEAESTAYDLLKKVGLAEKAKFNPSQLSGGQRQRVAIARALAMSPKAMLFDEATSALDPELVGEVLQVMADLARDGMTMVVVTHEMEFAHQIADRVCFMENGKVGAIGTPEEIFDNTSHPRLESFLNRFKQKKVEIKC